MTHLYDERDPEELEPYFSRHMNAMTAEDLRGKAAIACELAWRDKQIEELEECLKSAIFEVRQLPKTAFTEKWLRRAAKALGE